MEATRSLWHNSLNLLKALREGCLCTFNPNRILGSYSVALARFPMDSTRKINPIKNSRWGLWPAHEDKSRIPANVSCNASLCRERLRLLTSYAYDSSASKGKTIDNTTNKSETYLLQQGKQESKTCPLQKIRAWPLQKTRAKITKNATNLHPKKKGHLSVRWKHTSR